MEWGLKNDGRKKDVTFAPEKSSSPYLMAACSLIICLEKGWIMFFIFLNIIIFKCDMLWSSQYKQKRTAILNATNVKMWGR